MFILGQAVHLFIIKIPSLKTRAKATNKLFVFKEWWDCEWHLVLGTQCLGLASLVGIDEIANWKPEIWEAVKWFFFAVGAVGSSFIIAKWSKYEPTLINLIDVKSNIADTVMGGITNNVKEAIQKGSAVTGTDVSTAPAPK